MSDLGCKDTDILVNPGFFSTIQILIFEQRYHEVTIHKEMLHQQICVITDGL